MPDDEIRAFYSQVGRRVQRLREDRRLTQEHLAARLQLTRASIANLEAGRQRISAYHLVTLAATLGVTIGDLVPVDAPVRQAASLPDTPPEHLDLLQQVLAAAADDGDAVAHAAS